MATLPLALASPVSARVFAAKGSGGNKEDKSFVDWLLGNLTKEDQFYETDPILNKVEDKSGSSSRSRPRPRSRSGTTGSRKGGSVTVSVPAKKKKNGGGGFFGGLFAKK